MRTTTPRLTAALTTIALGASLAGSWSAGRGRHAGGAVGP